LPATAGLALMAISLMSTGAHDLARKDAAHA